MYVCMYVRMYVYNNCMYVCMYNCMYECNLSTTVCTYVCMYVDVYICTCTHSVHIDTYNHYMTMSSNTTYINIHKHIIMCKVYIKYIHNYIYI